MHVGWAADGGIWLMDAVRNGYGYERIMLTGESGGGFRPEFLILAGLGDLKTTLWDVRSRKHAKA